MNTKGVLNILHVEMTCPILDDNISDVFMDLQACNGAILKYTEKNI